MGMVKTAAEILAGVPRHLLPETESPADRRRGGCRVDPVRAWCRQVGLPVPATGPIAQLYVDAYNEAHPDEEPR